MPFVQNVKRVASRLAGLARESRTKHDVSVIVGYTASYALTVHENLNVPHTVGQAKYLEQPAREKRREIGNIVVNGVKVTKSMEKGLILGGLFLQRESQKLVPVDTGNLKGGAFTKKESRKV